MRGDAGRRSAGRLVPAGLGLLVVSLAGWLATLLGASWAGQPDTIEDLTPVWPGAGVTPLGASVTVSVPSEQTLVALLVGTDLRGIAGTTTGTCTARSGTGSVPLDQPVLLDFSVTGRLAGDREAVAVAGWRNAGEKDLSVDISCDTRDSTVQGFVAVPSRTAAFPKDPWFQPWGWVALGGAGAMLTTLGLVRSPRA
ncbi:MAG: hypothetical protein QG655_2890 [Actinomycetota bacterium]|nr:hypothetical protein [Actinomycetota bacterium]HPY23320.1 hypothetical protein [Mycobacterium sp.]